MSMQEEAAGLSQAATRRSTIKPAPLVAHDIERAFGVGLLEHEMVFFKNAKYRSGIVCIGEIIGVDAQHGHRRAAALDADHVAFFEQMHTRLFVLRRPLVDDEKFHDKSTD